MQRPEFRRPSREPDLEAEIAFLPTAEGGRRMPVASGYRPNHDFGLEGELNDATHEYFDREWVNPGDTVPARLWLFAPERQKGRLQAGDQFAVQEGGQVIGRGRITRVINSVLRHGA